MPLLGNLIVSIVMFLVSIFGRFVAGDKAFKMAGVALMLSLIAVMVGLMFSCTRGVCAAGIAGISASHPNFAVGLGMAFNTVTLAAASVYVVVWTGCQVYVIQKKGLNIISS